MLDETIVLLTYYYHQEDAEHPIIRHLIKSGYCSSYLPWEMYLQEPLQKIFSRVVVYDYLKRRAEVGMGAMNEEIIELVRKEGAKFVIWTSFYYDVRESTLQTLRQNGAVVLGWFFDDEWRFDSYSKYWIPYLDYCVTNAIEAVPKYQALGARTVYTIPNTGVAFAPDWSKIEERYDVSFVGSTDFADRRRFFDKVKQEKIPVQHFGGKGSQYLPFDQMVEVFETTRINLNFSKAGAYYWVRQIKGRVFQVCLAGGFMLTEYSPGIENFFEIGKEIACFDNEGEMVAKIKYYLEHDEERRTIARAGWERARNNHDSSHMVGKVFKEVERNLAAFRKGNRFNPRKIAMPLSIRTMLPSQYHYEWGRALLQEKYDKKSWRSALALSLSYSPVNLSARYCQLVGFLPSLVRPALFHLYDSAVRLTGRLLSGLRSAPLLGRILQRLVKGRV